MFGSYVLIPQLVELPAVTGYGFSKSTSIAGLIMLPSALVMLGAGPLSGWLGSRFGSRLPLALGGAFAVAAYLELALLHETLFEIAVGAVLIGIGIGLAFAAMANLIVEAVRQDQTGVATGINTIMRSIGGSIGAQVAAAILAGNVILGGRFPAEQGFTDAFAMSAVAAVVALVATALIPRPPSRRRALVAVGAEA
jgi:MFS family permease